jgi:hypothetical protein
MPATFLPFLRHHLPALRLGAGRRARPLSPPVPVEPRLIPIPVPVRRSPNNPLSQ